MISITILRDKEGLIQEFNVKGHAGYAKHGSDIVCAAVSAVAYSAVGALEELAGIKNYSENDGYMKCNVPSDISSQSKYNAQIILETMAIGFKQIEYSYKTYVSVLDKEV